MKHLRKTLLSIAMVVALAITVFQLAPAEVVYAAGPFTITYVGVDGTTLDTASVTEGSAIGTLPVITDSLVFVDQDSISRVTASTVPTENMTVTVYKTTDVSASGVMDSGNITWFIYNGSLYVVGDGTISILNRQGTGMTKTYGPSVNNVTVQNPSIEYDWMTGSQIGDELTTTYGAYTVPTDLTHSETVDISHPTEITGQTITYPATALATAAPWLSEASTITAAYFGSDVTLSGNFTFYFNQSSDAVIPSQIDRSAYTALTQVYLYSNTSGVTSTAGMFASCPALTAVHVPASGFDATSVTDMSAMFYGCEALTCSDSNSIVNNLKNTGSVTDMRYMFFDCKALEEPALSGLDTSNVTDMSYMFTGCANAKLTCGVSNTSPSDLQAWDTSKVISMSGMFAGPSIDLTLTEPITNMWGLSTANVTTGTFDLTKWNLGNLRIAYYMFGQNHGITGVKFSNSAPNLTDLTCAFAWCDQLGQVDMAGLSTPTLKYIDFMFFNAGATNAIADFSNWNMGATESAVYAFYKTNFRVLDFNGTNPSSLVNAKGMFANNTSLGNLGTNALGSWALPNLKDASFIFNADSSLSTINTSGWGMGSATDISYMFADCSALTALDLSGWNISNALTDMDCFLYNCANVPSLNVSNWDISGVNSAFMAFAKMAKLASLSMDGWTPTSLIVGNGMFAYDYLLPSVNFGTASAPLLKDASGMFYNDLLLESASVKNLIGGAATDVAYMFYGTESLESLDLSGWDTSYVEYMQGLFGNNSALASLTLGSNFGTPKALSTAIMFCNDELLPDATLQNFIENKFDASTVKDAYGMFENCALLTEADLTNTSLGGITNMTRMFYKDNDLVTISLPADTFTGIAAMNTNGKNVFYCDDTTPTTLYIDSASVPTLIANYDWDGDNRTFIVSSPSQINDEERTEYTIPATSGATATMKLIDESTVYLSDGKALPVSYTWKYGGSTLSNTDPTYTATKDTIGSYITTSYLADIPGAAESREIFTISKDLGITKITATYTGDNVIVSKTYSKDDVKVVITYEDDTTKTLASGDWSVPSQKVTKKGDNVFTASYTDPNGTVWSSNFTVPGIRVLGTLDVTYSGPQILVGSQWDKQYITAKAYYVDDTSKTEGITVTPTRYNSNTVSQVGANSFIATYVDSSNNNNELTGTFTVTGYKNTSISSIDATYVGPDIVVGNNYDKNNVKVTIHYSDGTADSLTTDFTVDSLNVPKQGVNTYTATYVGGDGKSYTANFRVTGIPATAAAATASGTSGTTNNGSGSKDAVGSTSVGIKTGDQAHVIATILIMFAFGAIAIVLVFIMKKRGIKVWHKKG